MLTIFREIGKTTFLEHDRFFLPYRINRLGIGRTFQDLRLATQMTVRENLFLALEKGGFTFSSKKQREKADNLMERFCKNNGNRCPVEACRQDDIAN